MMEDWSPEHRLALIEALVLMYPRIPPGENYELFMQRILKLCYADSTLLEMNRAHFGDALKVLENTDAYYQQNP